MSDVWVWVALGLLWLIVMTPVALWLGFTIYDMRGDKGE